MATQVGTIEFIAKIDSSKYKDGAKDIDKTNASIEKSSESASDNVNAGWSKAAKVGLAAAAAATVALTVALTKAARSSWDQVAAVEQATVGLKAYEKDGTKVNAVLEDLIKYARSDLGVLFNRRDLFQSAQMLKLNGVETEDLSKNVQILSRSVGLGLGNWQDLNSVVGRVVATGRLSGIEFDQLTQYGFKLDKSLRNTNISAEDLFKTLDKGIPVDAMEGQSRTIRGLGIRIETAFRGIGDAILGVDADTSKFVKGGLGDLIVQLMDRLPAALKVVSTNLRLYTQAFTTSFIPAIIEGGKQAGEYLQPKLSALARTFTTELMPAISGLVQSIGPEVGKGLVGALGLTIDALNILFNILTPVINFMADNTWAVWGLVGAFVALKTAIAITSGLAALQGAVMTLNASMVTATGTAGALRTATLLLSNPIVMVVTLTGAALVIADILAIKTVVEGLSRAFDDLSKKSQKVNTGGSNVEIKGNSGLNFVQGFKNYFGARAMGGPVSAGKAYAVGDNPDGSWNDTTELFVPRSSGHIVSNADLRDAMGAGGSSIENHIGKIIIEDKQTADYFLQKLTRDQEIISNGMVPVTRYG